MHGLRENGGADMGKKARRVERGIERERERERERKRE